MWLRRKAESVSIPFGHHPVCHPYNLRVCVCVCVWVSRPNTKCIPSTGVNQLPEGQGLGSAVKWFGLGSHLCSFTAVHAQANHLTFLSIYQTGLTVSSAVVLYHQDLLLTGDSNTGGWVAPLTLPGPHFTPQPKGQGWRLCQAGEGANCRRLIILAPLETHSPSRDQRHKQIFTGARKHFPPFPKQRTGQHGQQSQIGSPEALTLWSAQRSENVLQVQTWAGFVCFVSVRVRVNLSRLTGMFGGFCLFCTCWPAHSLPG